MDNKEIEDVLNNTVELKKSYDAAIKKIASIEEQLALSEEDFLAQKKSMTKEEYPIWKYKAKKARLYAIKDRNRLKNEIDKLEKQARKQLTREHEVKSKVEKSIQKTIRMLITENERAMYNAAVMGIDHENPLEIISTAHRFLRDYARGDEVNNEEVYELTEIMQNYIRQNLYKDISKSIVYDS